MFDFYWACGIGNDTDLNKIVCIFAGDNSLAVCVCFQFSQYFLSKSSLTSQRFPNPNHCHGGSIDGFCFIR